MEQNFFKNSNAWGVALGRGGGGTLKLPFDWYIRSNNYAKIADNLKITESRIWNWNLVIPFCGTDEITHMITENFGLHSVLLPL